MIIENINLRYIYFGKFVPLSPSPNLFYPHTPTHPPVKTVCSMFMNVFVLFSRFYMYMKSYCVCFFSLNNNDK